MHYEDSDLIPQVLDRVEGYDMLDKKKIGGTVARIYTDDVMVDWDDDMQTSAYPLWFVARERIEEIARYKDSDVIPALGDIVEPYDHFYQGTVIEIINEHFVKVDWRRWATEKHIEMEWSEHVYFVRRGE